MYQHLFALESYVIVCRPEKHQHEPRLGLCAANNSIQVQDLVYSADSPSFEDWDAVMRMAICLVGVDMACRLQ